MRVAVVGATGVSITSQRVNASSKAFLISPFTWRAFL